MKKIHFWGKVQEGNKRGKGFGFPTANQNLHRKIEEGIYVSVARVHDQNYNALTFIGSAKTFNETKYQAETYILNFDNIFNMQAFFLIVVLVKKIFLLFFMNTPNPYKTKKY